MYIDAFMATSVGKTARSRRNHWHVLRAIMELELDEGSFGWLSDDRGLKLSVLAELGMILDAFGAEAMQSCANQVIGMEPRPTVKAAVGMLRRWRLNRPVRRRDVYLGLVESITNAIDRFQRDHPEATGEAICEALTGVLVKRGDRRQGVGSLRR